MWSCMAETVCACDIEKLLDTAIVCSVNSHAFDNCTVGQYPLELRQSHWWNYSNYILYSVSNSTNDIAEVPVN